MKIIRFMALQSLEIEDSVISHFWLHPEIGPARTENWMSDFTMYMVLISDKFYAFCKKKTRRQTDYFCRQYCSLKNNPYHYFYVICEFPVSHAFFVYYENADLVYDVIRMRQLSKQTLHELSPNDNSQKSLFYYPLLLDPTFKTGYIYQTDLKRESSNNII